jgi:hypothetical protein
VVPGIAATPSTPAKVVPPPSGNNILIGDTSSSGLSSSSSWSPQVALPISSTRLNNICDGRVRGYYREELVNNPNLLRDGGLCVYCGLTSAEHPRRP